MEYVTLGKTGLKVSRICLGCMTYGEPASGELKGGRHAWALDEQESQPFLRQALDLGINFFDTANVYSSGASEEVLGRFLKSNARRESVVIATKVHGVMRDEPNRRRSKTEMHEFRIPSEKWALRSTNHDIGWFDHHATLARSSTAGDCPRYDGHDPNCLPVIKASISRQRARRGRLDVTIGVATNRSGPSVARRLEPERAV